MNRNDKYKLSRKTDNRNLMQRFLNGCRGIIIEPLKLVVILMYIFGIGFLWIIRDFQIPMPDSDLISPVFSADMLRPLFPVIALGGLIGVIVLLGTPLGRKAAKEDLQRIGLVNHAGEVPILTSKKRDKDNPRISIWEFNPCGVPLKEWEDRQQRIEAALNVNIVKLA